MVKQIINFLKYIIDYFKRRRNTVTVNQIQAEGSSSQDAHTLPPGWVPIELFCDMQPIPGKITLEVGTIARVLQTPSGEIVTGIQKKGIHCGCGHHIYIIDRVVTAESIHPGLGGQCPFCVQETAELYNQNLISLQQVEEMSLYCSQCAGRCDICRRNNICVRHTRQFEVLDGSVLSLCPECQVKAENDKFFKKTIAFMLLPFVDYRRLPPPKRMNPYDGY